MYDAYHILLLIHIAAVILWVGGGLMMSMLAEQVRRAGNPQEIAATVDRMDWFGPRFYSPLAVVTLLAGIGLAQMGPGFAAPWVGIGFLALIISGAISGAVLARNGKKLKALIASTGANTAEVQAGLAGLVTWSRINAIVLFIAVVDMVLKPGA